MHLFAIGHRVHDELIGLVVIRVCHQHSEVALPLHQRHRRWGQRRRWRCLWRRRRRRRRRGRRWRRGARLHVESAANAGGPGAAGGGPRNSPLVVASAGTTPGSMLVHVQCSNGTFPVCKRCAEVVGVPGGCALLLLRGRDAGGGVLAGPRVVGTVDHREAGEPGAPGGDAGRRGLGARRVYVTLAPRVAAHVVGKIVQRLEHRRGKRRRARRRRPRGQMQRRSIRRWRRQRRRRRRVSTRRCRC